VALATRERTRERLHFLSQLGLEPLRYQLATLHRAENTDDADAFGRVLRYLREQAKDLPLVIPIHPRARSAAARFGLNFAGLRVIDPVGYLDMMALLDGCARVFTDSGGLQKEAYFCRKPCVTLRDATEWTETIEAGWNRLWTQSDYRPRRDIYEYGDGRAAEKISAVLARELRRSSCAQPAIP
jgi:UDP-GlcNAc3NAcA epimerase